MTHIDARKHPHLAVSLTGELVARASVTPIDAGCQELLRQHLQKLGFHCETLVFGDVTNLWAKKGNAAPLFVFAGHTDVVPTGDPSRWTFDPFIPIIHDGYLYGRGSADMKGGIAAFISALEVFLEKNSKHAGSIGLLITSDEEGDALNGTVKVIETLVARGEQIDYCLIGEPTAESFLGDMLKNGRRGSLSGKLVIRGKQGHIAYPHLADNPIHRAASALSELTQTQWDNGNEFFPSTSFQVSNIHGGLGVSNVIPPDVTIDFNFRFSTASTQESLKERVEKILKKHNITFTLTWTLSGTPWLTQPNSLVNAAMSATQKLTWLTPKLSTSGGISDGRFIAPTGAQVIELGPLNATIHKIDERVSVEDLIQLSAIYEGILTILLQQINQ
jgi:succinyl-diaminopimelate desuccinylase